MYSRVRGDQSSDDNSTAEVGTFHNGDKNRVLGDEHYHRRKPENCEQVVGAGFLIYDLIYDFSPGTQGGRYLNRLPVCNIVLDLGRARVRVTGYGFLER